LCGQGAEVCLGREEQPSGVGCGRWDRAILPVSALGTIPLNQDHRDQNDKSDGRENVNAASLHVAPFIRL
jgi:hypothetical protein